MKQALLLIDHGSRRKEANDMLESLARLIQDSRPELVVKFAHMELAPPDIPRGFADCVEAGASEVIAFPYMLSPGRHVSEDLPRLLNAAASEHPGVAFRLTAPLGLHKKISEVILERAGL